MNIQEAIKTGKPIRRENWVTKEFKDFHEITLDENDILADDWEVEPIDNGILFTDMTTYMLSFDAVKEGLIMSVDNPEYITLSEENVDKLLTFLYNNTKVGKSRILPF